MINRVTSPWEGVLNQITSPWDWAAGATGAAIGFGATIMLGGADLGTSAAAGATAGVAARKALAASLQGRQLARRAQGLRAHIAEQNGSNPALMEILSEIDREQGLWQSGAIDNGQFAEQLNEIVKKYRAVSAGPLALPSGSGE